MRESREREMSDQDSGDKPSPKQHALNRRNILLDWKAVFEEQKKPGGFPVWYEPLTAYRIPKVFNLRMDPYERADIVSDQYDDWRVKNAYLMGWLNLKAAAFLGTFKDYPPSQIPASFTIDQVQKSIDDTIEALKKKTTTD
jgi:hypothetical protein